MPDPTGPDLVELRGQHISDMADIAHDIVDPDTPPDVLGFPTAFAVLRDIADAEPIYLAAPMVAACAMCHAEQLPTRPFEHRVSCPWARSTQIVGVRADG